MSTEPQAPSSFSHEKMEADKRYRGASEVPESLLKDSPGGGEFSIQGQFREGRAAYLDMSATTPLDPRVLDAMAPYMVGLRKAICYHDFCDFVSHSSISYRLDLTVILTAAPTLLDGKPKRLWNKLGNKLPI